MKDRVLVVKMSEAAECPNRNVARTANAVALTSRPHGIQDAAVWVVGHDDLDQFKDRIGTGNLGDIEDLGDIGVVNILQYHGLVSGQRVPPAKQADLLENPLLLSNHVGSQMYFGDADVQCLQSPV